MAVTDSSETGAPIEVGSVKLGGLKSSEIIKKFGSTPTDTGSPEVQIALLTGRIQKIAGHVKQFEMDRHSQRGMMSMISRRKKLLSYLKNMNIERYRKTIATLGLRK